MSSGEKTEQPTQRRRAKAREKGQVARSRELPGALAIAAILVWVALQNSSQVHGWRRLYEALIQYAGSHDITMTAPIFRWCVASTLGWIALPLLGAWALASVSTILQGGFVFSPDALSLKPGRMSPSQRWKQIFSTAGASHTLKSILPFSFILLLAVKQFQRDWYRLGSLSETAVANLATWILGQALTLGWKSALVLLVWSGVDYLLQRQRMESELKMSREELKQEFKESEANPQIKAKIRRLQRQVRRQQMLRAVKNASVVVANPTHFALALEYRPEMAAPLLVAKGMDRFAQEIRQMAIWHEVPVIENPPLAHALYRSVEVGQMIPSKLYTAVAEVLAAVYRAQAQIRRI